MERRGWRYGRYPGFPRNQVIIKNRDIGFHDSLFIICSTGMLWITYWDKLIFLASRSFWFYLFDTCALNTGFFQQFYFRLMVPASLVKAITRFIHDAFLGLTICYTSLVVQSSCLNVLIILMKIQLGEAGVPRYLLWISSYRPVHVKLSYSFRCFTYDVALSTTLHT